MAKTKLKNREIFDDGEVFINNSFLLEVLYKKDIDLSNLFFEDSLELSELNNHLFIWDKETFSKDHPVINHEQRKSEWKIPQHYKDFDIKEFLISKCSNKEETERVEHELELFEERNMIDVLKTIIYLVDIMEEHNIVWGVGRGSSVSSFCLYLIGVHLVNSLEYNLDIKEFLRD